ncbi:hypothetical protein ACJRO7_011067 [Eucalyptus globulus]|uniref:Helicase C-terminal domain-containing protein n=1 Tax=Eucalyptus globulus TaxID=34317 RepID=A0ABD3LF11_EUCGL
MEDRGLKELEKARLLSLALGFGFIELSTSKCLDRLVSLSTFITVEHYGNDFLAKLAQTMQDTEDWDDVQVAELEACGVSTDTFGQDILCSTLTNSSTQILAKRALESMACKASVAKQDCFILMPTGGGESLCYQVTTLKTCVTVVISPFISLILDQIITLTLKCGIQSTFLKSQQTAAQATAVLQELRKDKRSRKLSYVTLERNVGNPSFLEILKCLLRKLFQALPALRDGFVVNEAHCVRYYVKKSFGSDRNVHLLRDILKALGICHALVLEPSFDRPNLKYEVIAKTNEPLKYECVDVAKYLNDKCGIKTGYYHAGLAAHQRVAVQKKWHTGEVQVCFVVHNTMSKSIESYYQESRRAGRDNLPAVGIALYGKKDFSRVDECWRQTLLGHFGKSLNWKDCKYGSNPYDNCLEASSSS